MKDDHLPSRTLSDWKEAERELAGEFDTLSRRRIETAWYWGQAFSEIQRLSEHGDFLAYLDQRDIAKTRVYELIGFFHAFPEISEFRKFENLSAVRRAIKAPSKQEAETEEGAREKLTPAEKRLMERDQLREQAKNAEKRAAEAERKILDQAEIIEHYETGERVSEGFKQGRSVIENKQAEVSQLKKQISDLQSDLWDARKENSFLKRKLKEKDKQIELLKEGEI